MDDWPRQSGGARSGGTHWRFAEGTAAGMFETYVLVTNTSGTWASVTLTYRNAAGAVIGTDGLSLPPGLRGTVWANGATGAQDFTTEVTSTAPVLVERAMYWLTGSGMLALGTDKTPPSEADGPPDPGVYTLTIGTPGPTVVVTDTPAGLVVGRALPGSRLAGRDDATVQDASTWHGSHLSVGKRP